jgi:DNA-binding NtrC family response regulator
VGELPLATQARLLRVLETGEYIPVGSSEVRKTNVRIVAATNVNMEKAIADGRFREDLYYRLNCVSISIPPLRHRGDDIIMLFRFFAMEMQERYSIPPLRLTPEAENKLVNYSWPGNVRQLRNIVTNMTITAEERTITPEILLNYIPSERHRGELMTIETKAEEKSSSNLFQLDNTTIIAMLYQLRKEVDELNRIIKGTSALPAPSYHPAVIDSVVSTRKKGKIFEATDYEEFIPEELKDDVDSESNTGILSTLSEELIKKTLHETCNRRKLAAQRLGISERTLYRKIKEYGLE